MQLSAASRSVSKFHIYRKRKRGGSLFCYICFPSWSHSAFISLLSCTLILACLLAHNSLMTLKVADNILLVHRPASLGLGLISTEYLGTVTKNEARADSLVCNPSSISRENSELKEGKLMDIHRKVRAVPSGLYPPFLELVVTLTYTQNENCLSPPFFPSLYFFFLSPLFPPFLWIVQMIECFLHANHSEELWFWGRIRYGLLRSSRHGGRLEKVHRRKHTQHQTSSLMCQRVCLVLTKTELSHFSVRAVLLWNANPSIQFPWIPAWCSEPIWFSFLPSVLDNHSCLMLYFFKIFFLPWSFFSFLLS